MGYKDIYKVKLPIPEMDRDLNLIRFKTIFQILQESQNDVVHNVNEATEHTQQLEKDKLSVHGDNKMESDLDMDGYKVKSVKEIDGHTFGKGDKTDVIRDLDFKDSPNFEGRKGMKQYHDWIKDQLDKKVTWHQYQQTEDHKSNTDNPHNVTAAQTGTYDSDTIDDKLDEKLYKQTHEAFIENFDLSGDD